MENELLNDLDLLGNDESSEEQKEEEVKEEIVEEESNFTSVLSDFEFDGNFDLEDEDGQIITKSYKDATSDEKVAYLENVLLTLKDNKPTTQVELNDEIVDKYLQEKYSKSLADLSEQITDEDIMFSYYLDSIDFDENDEITEEVKKQYEDYLELLKKNNTYEKVLNKSKKVYQEQFDKQKQLEEEEYLKKQELERENSIQQVVKAAQKVDVIGNAKITDDVKEDIFDKLFTLKNSQDSDFFEKLTNSPELFKVAYWYYYGEKQLKALEDFYKGEMKKKVFSTTSSKPVTENKKEQKSKVVDIDELLDY